MISLQFFLFFVFFSPLLLPHYVSANENGNSPSLLPAIWEIPTLYENTTNKYLQEVTIIGRYHGQYWYADSNENNTDGWENRRIYLGFNVKFLQNLTIEAQINISNDIDPFYDGLYDAFLQWEDSSKEFAISVGRLDYVYTGLERSTSSKRLLTMERVPLVSQIMPNEVIGGYTKGKTETFSYHAGLFSGSITDEFSSFEGGVAALLGFSGKTALFYDKGSLHLDYLYNNGNEENNAFKPYDHIISLWHQGTLGLLECGIDLTMAKGIDDISDVWGITLLPTYDLSHDLIISGDKLQVAFRYHYASSNDKYGLTFNRRYEQKVTSGQGDSYDAFYLGLNYYIFRHKLKLMAGFEYFQMDNVADTNEDGSISVQSSVDGWSFVSGIRLYF